MRFAPALFTALASLGSPPSAFAQGGPPLITDDPGTPGNGNWEINVAANLEHHPGSYVVQSPDLDLNYGLGDRLQLKLEPSWQVEGNGQTKSEPGNIGMGLKWRFLDQPGEGIDMSVYPQLDVNPVTNVEIGIDQGMEILIPIEVARDLGVVAVGVEVGYDVVVDGGDTFIYGVAVAIPASRVELRAELHGESDVHFDSNVLVANAGAIVSISHHVAGLASVGRALAKASDANPDLLAYAGVQVHL